MLRFLHKLVLASMVVVLVYSCNKLPVVDPIGSSPATNTVADVINNTATYSILKAAVTKAGLLPSLSKSSYLAFYFKLSCYSAGSAGFGDSYNISECSDANPA
jgi:hypothetical protein